MPPIEQTIAEYLRALKPILTTQQYEKTKHLAKQFLVHPGPAVYQHLLEKREKEDNWVSRITL